ncbi:hypothetical protein IWW38_000616 [Coemansia aciculifera]|uniref:Uncharacterized protein n=1 Tax=Coemansia aciculifera TaxID=417176 RepID=A0ACC1M9K9_9FUNG|nr:hypothetical protein IWW38_000616 [Coemansia aciculifera]
MSPNKPLVVVFGATGNQGGSVLRTLAAHPESYTVRAITRSTKSRTAQELATKYPHVQWVEADIENPSSLNRAVANADVVFGVTQFFQPSVLSAVDTNQDAEFLQGKNVIDACVAENVGYVVFSTLPSAKKLSNGKITEALHFEGKYKIHEYLAAQPIDSAVIQLGVYFQNNIDSTSWNESGDTVVLSFIGDVHKKIAYVDVNRDTGPYVKYIIDNREQAKGKVFPVCSGYYSTADIAEALSKVTGLKTTTLELPTSVVDNNDLRAMFELLKTHEIFAESPNHLETNKLVPFEFTTPETYWRTSGFQGPPKKQ